MSNVAHFKAKATTGTALARRPANHGDPTPEERLAAAVEGVSRAAWAYDKAPKHDDQLAELRATMIRVERRMVAATGLIACALAEETCADVSLRKATSTLADARALLRVCVREPLERSGIFSAGDPAAVHS